MGPVKFIYVKDANGNIIQTKVVYTEEVGLIFDNPSQEDPTPEEDNAGKIFGFEKSKGNVGDTPVQESNPPQQPAPANKPQSHHHHHRTSKFSTYEVNASANDFELRAMRSEGSYQPVIGDEEDEVHVRCEYDVHDNEALVLKCNGDPGKPGYIYITDNTNGKKNEYRYQYISPTEIKLGRTYSGVELDKNQFQEGRHYYILTSVTDENRENIMSYDHVEVYRLDYTLDDENKVMHYDLVQTKGMQGSGKSSIDYNRR